MNVRNFISCWKKLCENQRKDKGTVTQQPKKHVQCLVKKSRNSEHALMTLLLTRLCLRATCSSHGLAAANSIHDLGILIFGNKHVSPVWFIWVHAHCFNWEEMLDDICCICMIENRRKMVTNKQHENKINIIYIYRYRIFISHRLLWKRVSPPSWWNMSLVFHLAPAAPTTKTTEIPHCESRR